MRPRIQWLSTLIVSGLTAAAGYTCATEIPPQRYGVFAEPLLASGQASIPEQSALAETMEAYRAGHDTDDTGAIQTFLSRFPASTWRASLWLEVGLVSARGGRYTDAISAFRNAREAAAGQPYLRPVEARALNDQLILETRLGHQPEVSALLKDAARLSLSAADSPGVSQAEQGLWNMQNNPQATFQCGWVALTALWHAQGIQVGATPGVAIEPNRPGYTLQQLVEIATKHQQPMHAVYQSDVAGVSLPAVAHLKSGHYATLLSFEQGRYRVADPVMNGELWMTPASLQAESSGYFLVRDRAPLLAGLARAVPPLEAQTVRGAGVTSSSDPNGFVANCDCTGTGAGGSSGGSGAAGGSGGNTPGFNSTGMPVYSISPMLVSLTLRDTPLSYVPPLGRAMNFTLSYNQLDPAQPSTFTYGNVGPKWSHNWIGFVQDNPTSVGSNVLLYLPSGAGRPYSGYNNSTGAFTPEAQTGAQLVRVNGTSISYERRFNDGSKDVYAASDNSAGYPRRLFLSRRVDAHGNAVTLSYDDQFRLISVTDALGKAMTFTYGNAAAPLLLTGVTDAFGRSASITYDAAGRLKTITDAVGMSSSVTYTGTTNSVEKLTTPYGTTSFVTGQAGMQRWINITDPNGNTSRMEFANSVSGIPFSESLTPSGVSSFNSYINSRNTFYWDAQAYKTAGTDYSKALIYHWAHVTRGSSLTGVTADSLESIKYPLENRIWYRHPGDTPGGSGVINVPNNVARVLSNGTTQMTQNAYNALGKATITIEPDGRRSDYVYAPNLVDLLKVTRVFNGVTTAESFTYDNQHNVLTHTDANNGLTQYTYNAAGQVVSITDPRNSVTSYTYVDGFRTSMTDGSGHITSYTYDTVGRLASVTAEGQGTTSYTYDALNRLLRTTDALGGVTELTYNKLDVATERDAKGNVTTYTYDGARNVLTAVDALNRKTVHTYYPNNLLASTTDPRGHTTNWIRDLEGRVTSQTETPGTGAAVATVSGAPGSSQRLNMAAINSLAGPFTTQNKGPDALRDPLNLTRFSYDPRGRVLSQAITSN